MQTLNITNWILANAEILDPDIWTLSITLNFPVDYVSKSHSLEGAMFTANKHHHTAVAIASLYNQSSDCNLPLIAIPVLAGRELRFISQPGVSHTKSVMTVNTSALLDQYCDVELSLGDEYADGLNDWMTISPHDQTLYLKSLIAINTITELIIQ